MDQQDMTEKEAAENTCAPGEQKRDGEDETSDMHAYVYLQAFYEQAELLSAASPIGLIITETDGTIISFNKAVQDLFGVTVGECRDTNVIDLYSEPHERQKLLDLLSRSHTVRDFEVKIRHKNGSPRTVLTNIDLIEWNNEQVLLSSLYDITQYEQRHSKDEHEKNYHTLFSHVPVGITVTDFRGNIIVSNIAISELLGYSAEELKNINILSIYLVPADRLQLLDLTKRLGSVRDFETTFRHRNGDPVTVLLNTDMIEFGNQKNVLLTSIRDISNLKRVEDELIKERDFSNAILNIAATLIVVLDRRGNITRFNRACEELSGYSFTEIDGSICRKSLSLIPSSHRKN